MSAAALLLDNLFSCVDIFFQHESKVECNLLEK